MIIVRFERFDKNAGKTSGGLFSSCTPMSDEGYAIKSRVGGMHQCPESDSAPGMRRFKAVVNGKKAIFGFTLEAFKKP